MVSEFSPSGRGGSGLRLRHHSLEPWSVLLLCSCSGSLAPWMGLWAFRQRSLGESGCGIPQLFFCLPPPRAPVLQIPATWVSQRSEPRPLKLSGPRSLCGPHPHLEGGSPVAGSPPSPRSGPSVPSCYGPVSANGCLASSVQSPGCLRQRVSPHTVREAPPADF